MPLTSLPTILFGEIIKRCQPNCHTIYFQTPNLTMINVTGTDASKFLQGQCTCDVQNIVENTAQISAICNIKGRIESLFYLIKKQEDFYLILPTHLLLHTITWLKKFAVFSKVTITDVTTTHQIRGIFCPQTSDSSQQSSNFYFINQDLAFAVDPQNDTENALSEAEWKKLLLYYQYPELHVEGIGKWLPFELGLLKLGAINFEKGCYLGQEIIARMHYRSNRHFEIKVAHVKAPLTPLYSDVIDAADKLVGSIIDMVQVDDMHYIVLLSIKDGIYQEPLFFSKGERYDIELVAPFLE